MTADQHNRLIEHAKTLVADRKWLATTTADAYLWAKWWAAMEPRKAEAVLA
jgi:hypothetical protein